MLPKTKLFSCFSVLIIFTVIVISAADTFSYDTINGPHSNKKVIKWCTINIHETRKCKNFAFAVERDKIKIGKKYFQIECMQAFNKEECMTLIDEEKATITTLDAGEMFISGRYHSLVPIMQEVYEGGFKYYYAVAVIKKGKLSDVRYLRDLEGKKACFAGVGTLAGWTIPVQTLMADGSMKIADCNNHVKSAIKFFGPSCAVNSLIDKYNPIGDNSDKLCQLCTGKIPGGRCTIADPYAGFEGAFKCLLDAGDIAFLKHTTVQEMTTSDEFRSSGITADNFELFCKDGTRRPLDQYHGCNWGTVPSNVIATTSASSIETRKIYQKFFEKAVDLYVKQNSSSSLYNNNQYQSPYDSTSTTTDRYNNYYNRRYKRQAFTYDNSNQANKTNNRFDTFGRDNYDPYNRNQQGSYNRNQQDTFNRNQDTFNRNQQGPFNRNQQDPFNRNQQDPFNRNQQDPFNRNQQDSFNRNQQDSKNNDRDGNDQFNRNSNRFEPFGPRNQNQSSAADPFFKDPYSINAGKYGENIDPYEDDKPYNRDRDFGSNNRTVLDYDRDTFEVNSRNTTLNDTLYENFDLFQSVSADPRHKAHNLLFQDTCKGLAILTERQQTYSEYLGKSLDIILAVRSCPVNRMTLCVTSDAELEKCIKMRTALQAQLLKPEMVCHKAHSQINCMQAIRSGNADVTLLDASDVYTAGLNYDLVPIISEVYNLGEPEYYVVAVAKEADPSTELTYLRGKNTCHTGINTAAGWVYPLAYLISNGWIRPYGCDSIRAAAEYFSKSCVPGALSTEYNTGVPYDNMCDLCHGSSYRYCRRDASEDYYGHTGAFRCLVEGGGDVAFVKHTTVIENTGGKRREWWARDALPDDFELLCPDGTRAEVQDYKRCNLGKVKANAVVTRGGYGYNETQIDAFINLFLYAQQFYGRKDPDEFSFSLFYSIPPMTDLIFQDATQLLRVIDPSKRNYASYLGRDFLRARRITDCHAGAATVTTSLLALVLSTVFAIFVLKQ